ncbi:PH domain-containing protein [Alkalihalobacillus sp. MEB130]|uniref:PH domain-containing protein n=1 Tax=Alkalihalobacillus sp. MEB130 TaxID=2976704 RepID=UPI0028DFAE23|nr:PH domain-containing protein [Alkalihalobacillus sp. MEB130]MDT8859945.1 PH domain-containing protein [Alkalihalobacillus sp. MEB130]
MSDLKRLHIAGIFVSFLTTLRGFLLPFILTFFLGSTSEPVGYFRFEFIWIGILFFVFISGMIHWLTFQYRIMEGELYIQRGFFVKKKRYIQQKRVQSIDITAGLFQRMFGLVKVKIETAGGGAEPEVSLIAVSREEAEAIRSELLKKKVEVTEEEQVLEDEPKEEEADFTWTLSKRDLIISALTSSGLGLTISAVAALFTQMEQFLPEAIYEQVFGFFVGSGWAIVLPIIVFIIFLSWCISFLSTLIKYGGFKVEKFGNELVITRGLIERRQLTIHTHRVTAVRIVRNLLRQPFQYGSVYVESAGGGTNDEQLSTVLLPISKDERVVDILAEILPKYAFLYQVSPVPKRSLIRFLNRSTTLPLLATVLIGWFINPIAYYGFIVVAICFLFGIWQYKDTGSGINQTHLWIRYRKISQTLVISEKPKIQAAEIRTSFFQRRRKVASFRFSVLSSVVGKSFTVMDLDKNEAEQLLMWYSNRLDSKRD